MTMHEGDFADLLAGLKDMREYRAGKREGFVVHEAAGDDACDHFPQLSPSIVSANPSKLW